jgi:CheY-like chemotaxis protein
MVRILLAASPEPRYVLERVLLGHDLVCAGTLSEAEHYLRTGPFDLIVCTVVFDESRMFDFLRLAKSRHEWQRIPFIVVRVRPYILDSKEALEGVAFTCHALGAAAFLDFQSYKVEPDRELRQALEKFVPA